MYEKMSYNDQECFVKLNVERLVKKKKRTNVKLDLNRY